MLIFIIAYAAAGIATLLWLVPCNYLERAREIEAGRMCLPWGGWVEVVVLGLIAFVAWPMILGVAIGDARSSYISAIKKAKASPSLGPRDTPGVPALPFRNPHIKHVPYGHCDGQVVLDFTIRPVNRDCLDETAGDQVPRPRLVRVPDACVGALLIEREQKALRVRWKPVEESDQRERVTPVSEPPLGPQSEPANKRNDYAGDGPLD